MGMNGAMGGFRNDEMLLGWPRLNKNDVTGQNFAGCHVKARLRCVFEPSSGVGIAQPVSLWRISWSADCQQAGVHKPDTIQACRGRAAMKPERRAEQ